MLQHRALTAAFRDALAVVLPTECSGCGAPDRALCDGCRLALIAVPHVSDRRLGAERITVWSALDYAGVAQSVIGAYKDGGRTDAAAALGGPLRLAVSAALSHAKPGHSGGDEPRVRLVTIPSSRRALRVRGFHPVELLLQKSGLHPTRVLRRRRQSADQVGLGREARERNLHGSLAPVRRLDGAAFVLVDDIVTTGATLFEARRAIHEGGGEVIGFATLAETRRRF